MPGGRAGKGEGLPPEPRALLGPQTGARCHAANPPPVIILGATASDDVDALARPDLVGPALAKTTGDDAWLSTRARLVAGGYANLTFELTSDAGRAILRRPPRHALLRQHENGMQREVRVQRALAHTDVPVAGVVLDDQGELIGVPCCVVERIDGHVIRGELPEGYATTTAERQALAYSLVSTLANLGRVDPRAVGLADYGRHHGCLEQQLDSWSGHWQVSHSRPTPDIDTLVARLRRRMPKTSLLRVVHGDFRMDNCVMDPREPGRVRAVLDWEHSTLGDPLSDLGSTLMSWRESGESHTSLTPGVSDQAGFPSRSDLAERYAALSGLDLDDLPFYEALAHLKLAIILQSLAAHAAAGNLGGRTFDDLDAEVRGLAADGLRILS